MSGTKKVQEESKFYKLKLLFIRIRHGLFLMTVRSFLSKFGLDIRLDYIMLEGSEDIEEPKIKGDERGFVFTKLEREDLHEIGKIHFNNLKEDLKHFDNGMRFIGIKNNKQIAAYMCIESKGFTIGTRYFPMQTNEVYLLNMYTYQEYRGKNLAPYLRYHSYKMLQQEGVERIYSLTDFFNKSSWKFKMKLKARPTALYFSIVLFKRLKRTFKIKSYLD